MFFCIQGVQLGFRGLFGVVVQALVLAFYVLYVFSCVCVSRLCPRLLTGL